MRNTFFLLNFITAILVLAACSPSAMPDTETTVLSFPTNTLTPMSTATSLPPTSTIRPTETVVPTPDYVQAFIDAGYDKKSTDSDFFVMYDESSVHYLPGDGIVFNERVIRSWAEVDYIENGVWKRGIVINFLVRGGKDIFSGYGKYILSSSQQSNMGGTSIEAIKAVNKAVNEHTDEGGHPIMHTSLTRYPDTGATQLFEGIFPMVDGKLQPVNISGIGIVLPFCELRIPEIPIY
jgi:hypothetical protein